MATCARCERMGNDHEYNYSELVKDPISGYSVCEACLIDIEEKESMERPKESRIKHSWKKKEHISEFYYAESICMKCGLVKSDSVDIINGCKFHSSIYFRNQRSFSAMPECFEEDNTLD